jgi:hypothetical protein
MMTFTTLLPTTRNDGSRVSRREMDKIIQSLRDRFGGVTVEGEAKGQWTSPGGAHGYRDRSVKVTVACNRERLHEAAEAVRAIGRQLGQRAMWFEVRGADGVEILEIE